MSRAYNSSYITVRCFETSTEIGKVNDSRKPRSTEVEALIRMAYGDPIPATNNKVYDREYLKCSCCGQTKHLDMFHRDARYTWRQGRRYECTTCEKLQAIDQKSRRAKRLARQKTA